LVSFIIYSLGEQIDDLVADPSDDKLMEAFQNYKF
jgi:hypothetical protein